jgi:hypothetical protein
MTRFGLFLLAGCALAAGCGDDNTTAPSTAPVVFTAQLRPANEVPPITNAESGGTGAVQITFEGADAGAQTASFHIQLSGFPAGTTLTGAHIHPGAPGVNGGVVVGTGISATTPLALTEGITSFDTGNINVSAATAQAILNNPGGFYFNVHSTVNPGGVARGQLVRIQ